MIYSMARKRKTGTFGGHNLKQSEQKPCFPSGNATQKNKFKTSKITFTVFCPLGWVIQENKLDTNVDQAMYKLALSERKTKRKVITMILCQLSNHLEGSE